MAIEQPVGTDKLNSPSHSKLHRVFAADTAAPDESVTVDASGNVDIAADVTAAEFIGPLTGTATGNLTPSGAATVTDKRITRRSPVTTQSATPTINTDVTDVVHIVGLAQAITSMSANLSGTPVEGDMLRIDITDNGTARAIGWGASFESSGNAILPTTTVINVRLDTVFVWNTVTLKWRCVGVA